MMKHDSNMLINHEFDVGGIGKLSDKLNELLELRRKEKQHYQEKEALIADTYTNLSHDIRTPLTSLDGYFQLMEECENIEDHTRNEIDVMCVAGTMPVFISCKMASPSPLALSEIEVLCRRFGGEAARAVVVTAAEPRRDSPAIYQRAKDLGITLIGGDVLRTGKLAQCLRRAAK